ncbi:MAG: tryptophan/tyrosine permease [Deltaproteobacteria bacterium]|nr:tryptophan/tyrosine permease [Deltaproteobacteria bacterium]
MPTPGKPPVWTMALLIAGCAVGAGILALPVQTGLAGLAPAGVGMVVVWAVLLASAWVLARLQLAGGDLDADLPTLYHRHLGPWGKWLAVVGYLIIYYGILVAYLAGAASVLAHLLDLPQEQPWLLLGFFVAVTGLALFSLELVRRGNALLMALLLASFVFLIWQAGRHIEPQRLLRADWPLLPSSIPLIVTTLAYHNLIPVVCRALDGQAHLVKRALLLGSSLPLLVCLVWMMVVVGSLPLTGEPFSLYQACQANEPATVPLACSLNTATVATAGLIFSLCAIITSYLPVSVALMAFLGDLLEPVLPQSSRALRALLVFGPPLAVVYLYPNLFLTALDVVGGLGVGILYLLLPALMLLRNPGPLGRFAGWAGWGLLVLALGFLALELQQELGWLSLGPGSEFWK